MAVDKRSERRQDLTWDSFIMSPDGSVVCECRMLNVSASGAKLALREPTDTPEEFVLMLSRNGAVQRRCKVVRRADKELGVKFVQSGARVAPPDWDT
jgi:hypothetical protein